MCSTNNPDFPPADVAELVKRLRDGKQRPDDLKLAAAMLERLSSQDGGLPEWARLPPIAHYSIGRKAYELGNSLVSGDDPKAVAEFYDYIRSTILPQPADAGMVSVPRGLLDLCKGIIESAKPGDGEAMDDDVDLALVQLTLALSRAEGKDAGR